MAEVTDKGDVLDIAYLGCDADTPHQLTRSRVSKELEVVVLCASVRNVLPDFIVARLHFSLLENVTCDRKKTN